MGRGVNKNHNNSSLAPTRTTLSLGWRFFIWPDNEWSKREVEIADANHPYVKFISNMEQQLRQRLRQANVEPLSDIDYCVSHGEISEGDNKGSCGVNNDERIQLVMHVDDNKDPNEYAQVFLHEYCHGLFLRAFIRSNSDGRLDLSKENGQKVVQERDQRDTIVSETLSDVFALMVHKQVTLNAEDTLLPWNELIKSDDYDHAYSLKKMICSLIIDKKLDGSEDNFIYKTLKSYEKNQQATLWQCFSEAIRADDVINPTGKSLQSLYQEYYDSSVSPANI